MELPDSPADLTEYYANLRDAIDGKAELLFPAIDPEDVKCQWLYAVEIRNKR